MPRRLAALFSLVLAGSALVPAVAHADCHRKCEHRKVIHTCGYRGHGTAVIRPRLWMRDLECRTLRQAATVQAPCGPTACGQPATACSTVVVVTSHRPRITTDAYYRQVDERDLDLAELDAQTFDELPEAPG